MNKLNLHDSLRIYLPGLLLCVVFYFVIIGSFKDVGDVALPSIFVGLILDICLKRFHRERFESITNKYVIDKNDVGFGLTFYPALREIYYLHLKKSREKCANKISKYEKETGLWYVRSNFFSKTYSTDALLFHRAPKSYGVLCFNAAIVCVLSAILLSVLVYLHKIDFEGKAVTIYELVLIMLSIAIVLYIGSEHLFKESLRRELCYFNILTSEEIKSIVHLIWMYEQLSTNASQER